MTKIFVGVKEDKVFTRESKTKQYAYVVIGKQDIHSGLTEEPDEWQAVNWCSRLDLARAKAKQVKDFWQVEILPVFEKTAGEVRVMKEDIERQKRAQAEALQAYEEDQARIKAEEEAARQAEEREEAEEPEIKPYEEDDLTPIFDEQGASAPGDEEAEEVPQYTEIDLKEIQEEVKNTLQKGEVFKLNAGGVNLSVQMGWPEIKEVKEEAAPTAGAEGYAPSLICKACGRILTGPESIARGYGDKCWRRVWKVVKGKEEPTPEQKKDGGGTITDPAAAFETRLEIDRRVCESEETCICGESVRAGELRSYDHEGGYRVPGYLNPQWFYMKCGHCYHENSLRKMASVDIEDLETEGRKEAGVRLAKEEAAKAAKAK